MAAIAERPWVMWPAMTVAPPASAAPPKSPPFRYFYFGFFGF